MLPAGLLNGNACRYRGQCQRTAHGARCLRQSPALCPCRPPETTTERHGQHHHEHPCHLPVLHQDIEQIGQRRVDVAPPHGIADIADPLVEKGILVGPQHIGLPGDGILQIGDDLRIRAVRLGRGPMPDHIGAPYDGYPHDFGGNQRVQNIPAKIRSLCNGAASLQNIFVDGLQAGAGFQFVQIIPFPE